MNLNARILTLHPRHVFRISRADEPEVRNVIVTLENSEGALGWGEASPNAFYHETAEDVIEKLGRLKRLLALIDKIEGDADIQKITSRAWDLLKPSRAALCALDLALWDFLGRARKQSVCALIHGEPPRPIRSCCTIGLSTAEELAQKVDELKKNPIIKIKMNAAVDLEGIRYIRERTSAELVVDANCSWALADVATLSRELRDLGVAFIEQPLPPEERQRMPAILKASVLPILADESCVESGDVAKMPGYFSGFNIKLVKCGGISPALEMLDQGKKLGLRTMVGCMLESSVLIAAGGVIGQRTDYADLDGAWLLKDDPFQGLQFKEGILSLPDTPGFGVEPRSG